MESEADEESQDTQVIEIPVDFDDNTPVSQTQSNTGVFKGKYYRQTYRTAWEQMPDFKGWLRGVQGEPTRAYCIYCQKTLHAHRLSLLKHTCTIRHQKAAQIHNTRKNKTQLMDQQQEVSIVVGTSGNQEGDMNAENADDYGEHGVVVMNAVEDMGQEGEQYEEVDDEEEEPENIKLESLPVQFQKQFQQQIVPMAYTKPPISTHVLDTSRGQPVCGLQVSLYKLIDGRWTYINEGLTTLDGRCANFIERSDFSPGRYKLHYDVDRYFEARKQDTLYPFIEIVFDCRAENDHYHVPLLLNPFGYTTYRGS